MARTPEEMTVRRRGRQADLPEWKAAKAQAVEAKKAAKLEEKLAKAAFKAKALEAALTVRRKGRQAEQVEWKAAKAQAAEAAKLAKLEEKLAKAAFKAKALEAASKAKAVKVKAGQTANASGSESSTCSFEPFTIKYLTRTILVARPKTYKAAVKLVYENFKSLREQEVCFMTTQVEITKGNAVELTANAWNGVIGSITSVEVVRGEQNEGEDQDEDASRSSSSYIYKKER